MTDVAVLSLWQLAAAYLFVLILVVVVRVKKLGREKEIVLATSRMTLQLVAVGYLLVYLIGHPSPWLTLLIVAVMEVFAVHTISRQTATNSVGLTTAVAVAMVGGTGCCLAWFVVMVVAVDPWYEPRHVIPLAGMLIGNSMTGITLGVNQLVNGMADHRRDIEAALMLGAVAEDACKQVRDRSFDAAIIPTVNSMLGMGIVFLPGMMTGQILSGTDPRLAVAYQIAIVLGIAGSVALTVVIFNRIAYRSFFTDRVQLVPSQKVTAAP
ncbi:ABC transporter permease [Corynebacterium mendelii]|uniref:Iron export ABC transporter permease subunit FetB n=1 Tax=Corynebacterium mendelii TaxID=2765362 RepID=A0A939E1T9_9CORY|nr:iron export ABC transporter permease subunit FetB [Corynebacterium mendelii]MBN9643962.1 iron export ABC transporter permease subunit FetB [Corynebacterium mendelii]